MKKKLLFVWLAVLALFIHLPVKGQYLMTDTCTTSFIDISSSGTALGLSDDGEATITIPFNFVFGGVSSSDLRVGNNGGVLFDNTSGDVSFSNSALSSSTSPGFYVFWDDIYNTSGDVYWEVMGSAPNRQVVIEWYNRPHISVSGSDATFEIVLSESDMSIRFIYQDVVFGNSSYDYGASATIGIVTPAGDAFQYSYNSPSLNGINCILFQPVSADASINEILSPSATLGCGATGNFDVTALIASNGSDTLYNLDVSYSFDNGSWITETIDTLLPFAQDTFTFSTQVSITTPGSYPLSVAVYNANDENGTNDTINTYIISQPVYSSFPYLDDFESAPEWTAGGNASWELGSPAGTNINTAFSGSNAWMTNLAGNYANSENGYVESPCFDFSALDTPVVELVINYNTESCCDGAYLQVSIDDGATWLTVGQSGDPYNWYNNSSGWRGNSGGWLVAKHILDTLGHQPSVKFRMVFTSDGSVNSYDGVAFDNFTVYEKPSKDAELAEIIEPIGNLGCGISGTLPVTARIVSNGYDTLYNVDISYSVNGGTWVHETLDTLLPYNVDTFTFSNQISISSVGSYSLVVAVAADSDQVLTNDTLSTTFVVPEIITSFPYLEDFESPNTWTAGGNASWELGSPAGTNINTAFSGSNVWMTNLTGNYANSENGYVESPCFDFSALDTPVVELAISYNTESCCDGAYLQVSIDDGATWLTVGQNGDPYNWYNNSSGWRGNSGGWLVAKHILDTLGHQPSVKFRMVFTSDGSVNSYDGVAFDDFKVYDRPHNDLMAQSIISPVSGMCCATSQEQVVVQIYNNGMYPQDTFDISVSIDSGATWTTETYNDTILASNTLQYTFSQLFDFSTPDTYYVFVAVHNSGDELPDNDTIMTTVVIPAPITTLPYVEDFETTPISCSVDPTSDYTWFRNSGSTSSSNTGPSGDHTTGSGYYMFTEASNGSTGDVAILQTPCFDFSGVQVLKLSFWYHMYGSDIDRLYIEVSYPSIGWTAVDSLVGQQQAGSSDPWLKKEILLPDSICSVRFRAIRGSGYYGDIAIDDISIMEVPDYDLAINEIVAPTQTCSYTNAEQITISVVNVGLQDVSGFTLAYSIDSGATWSTETYSGTLASLDTLIYTFTSTADMSAYGTYNIITYVSYSQDTLPQNDTAFTTIMYEQPIPVPYSEDFENTLPGVDISADWEGIPSSNGYAWQRNSGATPSSSTGPSGDHTTGNGYYVYTEASTGSSGDEALLVSKCFDLSAIQDYAKLSFWYHMYGSNINRLYVEGFDGTGWFVLDSIMGQQQASENDAWKQRIVIFPSDTLSKLRFRAIRGSSYEGDIAIDDIQIGQASSIDIEAISINVPQSSCSLGSSETISMEVSNVGFDTIAGFNLAYSLDSGNTWTSEYVNQSIAPGEVFSYTFSTPADFSAPGDYYVIGLAGAIGDTINYNDTAYAFTSHIPQINTYPYFVDFESGMSYWHTDGSNASWEYGEPTVQDTAYSVVNCWATNLSGNYNNNEESYLYTPCFDFSTIQSPKLQFALNYDLENGWDYCTVEYSTDTGATWNVLGSSSDSAWYNTSSGWSGASNGWVIAYHDLSSLAGEPFVVFRFHMSADGSTVYNGVMVDNFKIYQDLLPDLAVVYPYNGGTVNICSGFKNPVISVKNVDSVNVVSGTNIGVNYVINNGTVHNETITLNNDLLPGDSITHQFADAYYFANNNSYNYKLYISVPNADYVNDTVVGIYYVQDLTVDIGPDTIWTNQPDTIVLDAGAGFESYLWNDGSTNQTLSVNAIGTYYVQVTDMYGCEASDTVVVALGTRIDLVESGIGVEIYPNPNTGLFSVTINGISGNVSIEIVDMSGRIIKKIAPVNTNKVSVNLNKYGAGVYYVKVISKNNTTIRKVVVN